jgi:dolichyl-phosphate-mannose--protein O-mannosyl transferase
MSTRALVREVIFQYGGIHGFAEHFGISSRNPYRYLQWGYFSKEVAYMIERDSQGQYKFEDLVNPKHLDGNIREFEDIV